jgi:hypothetical protein
VINLKVQNDAVILNFFDKFYNKKDILWVSLIWSTYYSEKVPHAAREVGSFGGRIFFVLTPISEELLAVFLVMGLQSCSRMTSGEIAFLLMISHV